MTHKPGDRYHLRPEHYAARNDHDMPSMTPRKSGARDAAEDSFGYEGQGGSGDFRSHAGPSAGQGDYAESQGRHAQSGQGRGGVPLGRLVGNQSRGVDVRGEEGDPQYVAAPSPGQRGRASRLSRSDGVVREEVWGCLVGDPQLDASEIVVMVEAGVVTLTGKVEKRWMKQRAEDLAAALHGDLEIVNLIKVENGAASSGSPGDSMPSGRNQEGSPSRVPRRH